MLGRQLGLRGKSATQSERERLENPDSVLQGLRFSAAESGGSTLRLVVHLHVSCQGVGLGDRLSSLKAWQLTPRP